MNVAILSSKPQEAQQTGGGWEQSGAGVAKAWADFLLRGRAGLAYIFAVDQYLKAIEWGLFLKRTSLREEQLDGRYRIAPVRMQLLVLRGRQGFEWILLDNRSFLKVVAC